MYPYDYLEHHEGNTSAMLKEYDKYLDDPEDYWKNRKNKLQQA